jgi:HEAT repeat protein
MDGALRVLQASSSGAPKLIAAESEAWFIRQWERAARANREAVWLALPEDIFDALDEDEGSTVTDFSVRFLAHVAVSTEVPTIAAVSAIRLMGILAEESFAPIDVVLPTLRDALSHDDFQRRYYAVKAMWQARAKGGVPALRRLVEREESEELRTLAKRAIGILS